MSQQQRDKFGFASHYDVLSEIFDTDREARKSR